jgi:hypothetical protein
MPRVIADRKFSCFDVRMMIARLGVVRAKLSSRSGPVKLNRLPGEMGLGTTTPQRQPVSETEG